MTEECIICDESGGLYVTCGSLKSGPYCSDHRWKLQAYVVNKTSEVMEDKFNDWVDEFQKKARRTEEQ